MRSRSALLLLALVAASCSAGDPEASVRAFGGPTMGSTYEVKYVADVPVVEVRGLVEGELAAFDRAFSRWRDDSDIAAVNRHASTEPFPTSPLFARVLQQALDVAAATDGAFDPTVGPLTEVYRRAKEDPQHRYDEAAARAALARVGYRHVSVRDGAVVKARPDIVLDLDGIVAGAAADAIAARLVARGIAAFYLQITGEVLCRGEKAAGVPWRIGIVDPVADQTSAEMPVRELPLRDRALCTSGDYRNAMMSGGKVRHHVFDPRTGRSAEHGVVSVSVLARSAALADALGTAFLVLGDEATAKLLPRLRERDELGAYFLTVGDDGALRPVEMEWPK